MKKVVVFGLLAVLAGAVLSAPAGAGSATASAAGPVYTPKQCLEPRLAPQKVFLGCPTLGIWMRVKGYEGPTVGKARTYGGGFLKLSNCRPDCKKGKVKRYSAGFKLHRPREGMCGDSVVRYHHRATIFMNDDRPKGFNRRESFKLRCEGAVLR